MLKTNNKYQYICIKLSNKIYIIIVILKNKKEIYNYLLIL